MITLEELRSADPRDTADQLTYVVQALVKTARLALGNTTSGQDPVWATATVLELAEEFLHQIGEGCEFLERERRPK